jgi:D-tyrosyl-tRNA(Tyr) deacylase
VVISAEADHGQVDEVPPGPVRHSGQATGHEGDRVRALVQTVSRASVTVDGEVTGSITDGLLVLLGVTHDDTAALAATMARKVYELRILDGDASAADAGSPLLVVSQFTLYGDARKGRRPTWSAAAPAEVAEPLVTAFVEALRDRGATVSTGRFRAHMLVESVNVGPRTVLIEL